MRCAMRCKESKGSKSSKPFNIRGKDNREGTERIRNVSDHAKDAPRASPGGVSPISLISPTGITHSLRRPRPPLPPAFPPFPTNENFLEAEQFNHVVQPENRTAFPSREQDGAKTAGEFDVDDVSLNTIKCDSPLDTSERENFARYLPDIAQFKPTGTSKLVDSTLINNPSENADQTVEFATHEPEWSAFQQAEGSPSGRIQDNPTFDRTEEKVTEGSKTVQHTMVNPCVHSRKVQLQDCTNGDYDFYRDSCGVGNYRGDDEDFFMNHASNPQAPDSPNLHESTDHDVPQMDSSEDTIQKRSLLYPEASLVEEPDTSYQNALEDSGRIGKEAASILDIPPAGDTSTTLRDFRLSLLFQEDAANTPIPQARLSRALDELDLQDLTMDDLHEELLINKQVLAKTQGELKTYDLIAKEQQIAIADFMVKLFSDKQWLHDRLQRESEENSMLQTRLTALQMEVSQLRSNLRSVTWELTKSSNESMEESQNEVTSRALGRSADLPCEDSALVASLRSEISDLQEQLESAKMHGNRLLRSREYFHADVMRLKCQLERAVVELLGLKRARIAQAAMSEKATEELRAASAHSENALRMANEKEHLLSNELKNTKAILASLENSSRADHDESLLEIRELKQRIGTLEQEAELAKKSAQGTLELCRVEADELRSEVHRLLRALDEEKKRAHHEASERTKERLEFDCKLSRSQEREKYFADKIQNLEECLAKSEQKAIARPLAAEDRALKIQYEGTAAEKALVEQLVSSEVGRLYRSLRKKEEDELRLKAKVKQLADKVQHAQAHADIVNKQVVCLTKVGTGKSSELERDLNNLKSQLADETAKAAMTEKERERLEAELHNVINREATLEKQMKSLKARLESSEAKMYDEMSRADEEQRIAIEIDTELATEVNRLKSKLRHSYTSNTTPGSMITSERKAIDVSRNLANSVGDRELLATIKADSTRELLGAEYEEALTFELSIANGTIINESVSTVPTSNSTIPNEARYPASTGNTPCLPAPHTSPAKFHFHSGVRATMPLPSEKMSRRTKGSCLFNPNWMNHTAQKMDTFSPDSSCDSPLSLPPRFSIMGLPPTQVAIPSNFEEGDDSSAEFRNGIDVIRKTSNRRLDIMQIQRRLIQSTERLTAAKSKLQVLAGDCDENREDQRRLKSNADFVVVKITEQTKAAMEKSICRQPSNLETISCTSKDAHNSCADRVLERYRIYKASRLLMSPGILDDMMDGDEEAIQRDYR